MHYGNRTARVSDGTRFSGSEVSALSQRKQNGPGVVANAFNPSTWEAEAGRFLSSRPAWSTK
jgi:major histocompatibility complex class I